METPTRTHHHLQQEHSSSRFTNNLTFFISSIIIFIFIVGAIISVSYMLKLELESESLSANPSKAIRDVCHLFHYFDLSFDFSGSWIEEQELKSKFDGHKLCFDSISSLHSQNYRTTITPSMIFHLSLQVAIPKIKNLRKETTLKECKNLLNGSESQLNASLTLMGVDPSDAILRDDKLVNDMKLLIKNALVDLEGCLTLVKGKRSGKIVGVKEIVLKINISKSYLDNCLEILNNLEKIFQLFYPSIGSSLGVHNFHWRIDTLLSIVFFCSQYVMLIIIVGVFLHVWCQK